MAKKSETPKIPMITRTMITGYTYNVYQTKGDNLVKVSTVTAPAQFRSAKQQKEFLKSQNLDENFTMVLAGTTEEKREISEEDFLKYSKIVTDETPADSTEQAQ